ncbi:MAG: hypothetical protein ACE5HD_00920 [Acidobacteriota bacterium]
MISNRPQAGSLVPAAASLGVVGLVFAVLLGSGDWPRFWASYLVAVLFCTSLALGALFMVLVHFATRAGWSVVVRRLAEHLAGTLPVISVLFLPVLILALPDLYAWARPGEVAGDPILQEKRAYLNTAFFRLRALAYLIAWSLMAWWFRRQSLRQDEQEGFHPTRRLQAASGPSLVVLSLAVTFAAFDWIMSLDPHWWSSVFGVYFFSGCMVAAYAFLPLAVFAAQRSGQITGEITSEHFHDLGKMLFAFVVFWAYIAFSQFLLIWYGAIPQETEWYAHRLQPGWRSLTVALAVGHFVVPFLLLLSRHVKRKKAALAAISAWMLAVHYLDLYWLVVPSVAEGGFRPLLLDAALLLGLGGLTLSALGRLIRGRALVPVQDPRLEESLSLENI